jgi:hypothetical protein
VRPIRTRRIAPAQTVPDDEDDAADDPPVINPRNPRATKENTVRSGASAPR